MSAKVVFIGLDAAEATLLEQWAEEGVLESFASLIRNGTTWHLDNSLETLPGAIWPELVSGISCAKRPLYYHSRQLHSGEARVRAVSPEDVDADDYFWVVASREGKRVAAIDLPQTLLSPGINGIQLCEWGLHDRNFKIVSEPESLLAEIRERFGDHPVTYCDRHGEVEAGYRVLLKGLLNGARMKSDLLCDFLDSETWDLFAGVYGETHCVGHQFWHFKDPAHPRYDPQAPTDLREAIPRVYEEIDKGIGRILRMAGPGATVIVVASHGMGLYTSGPQLLPEILVRLGCGSAKSAASATTVRRFQTSVSHLPRHIQPLLRWAANTPLAKWMESKTGCLLDPLESEHTRAVALRNNRCGAIRLNMKGREPNGSVEPGAEADALVAYIREELLQLVDPATGENIVVRVTAADEAFGAAYHPDVPDIMVVFRADLGLLERCTSPTVGDVRVPIYHPNIPRTGDHTTESRMWVVGSGIPAGERRYGGNVLDLAPTILDLLGVTLPSQVDGKSLMTMHAA